MSTTIVSGFLTNINNIEYRKIQTYVDYGKKLINIRTPKVIFMDKKILDDYFSDINDEYTKLIAVEKKDLYFYNYLDNFQHFKLGTDNPNKDTLEYMFIQNHKTEWVKQAIEFDFFKTEQYVWIDFGIYHIIKDDKIFEKCVNHIITKSYSTVRMAGIWDLNNTYQSNIFYNISWYFCGGLFGGHKDKLLEFATLSKQKCMDLIKNNHIMWEVNVWYLVFLDLKQKNQEKKINWYAADHNLSMFLNY